MALTMLPEPIEAIADRLEILPEKLSVMLEEMPNNGLIFKINKKVPFYMAAQFVIGIWEYHVNSLDPRLIKDFRFPRARLRSDVTTPPSPF